ncbi:SAM-dependent methyltransferase [Actinomadura fibrosa]|uniref:Class I SAM-dependent methyltransferase n=1 Tax=Actinomadura fibrosa TaxID=111802 RepID=A0ABW2XNL7_9ACTN|nr:cyclopropane-fatty-acyl-phospholipid synthase family protein [Actinomadura fibrosa]
MADPNGFHALLLDPALTYSCAYWTSRAPGYGAAEAQRDKLDLVCRKLGLGPGSHLLDVDCGWGSLLLHAAARYGARATGVAYSEAQRAFVDARIAERGLRGSADVQACGYRDAAGGPFDAVSSIEAGEYAVRDDQAGYCATLYRRLRPGGRLLLQQITRGRVADGDAALVRSHSGAGLAAHALPVTLGHLESAGFEIREVVSLREHYVATMDAWWDALNGSWDAVVDRVGARRARSWRLYLAGGSLAFQTGQASVHQILAVRPHPDGRSGFPLVGERTETVSPATDVS